MASIIVQHSGNERCWKAPSARESCSEAGTPSASTLMRRFGAVSLHLPISTQRPPKASARSVARRIMTCITRDTMSLSMSTWGGTGPSRRISTADGRGKAQRAARATSHDCTCTRLWAACAAAPLKPLSSMLSSVSHSRRCSASSASSRSRTASELDVTDSVASMSVCVVSDSIAPPTRLAALCIGLRISCARNPTTSVMTLARVVAVSSARSAAFFISASWSSSMRAPRSDDARRNDSRSLCEMTRYTYSASAALRPRTTTRPAASVRPPPKRSGMAPPTKEGPIQNATATVARAWSNRGRQTRTRMCGKRKYHTRNAAGNTPCWKPWHSAASAMAALLGSHSTHARVNAPRKATVYAPHCAIDKRRKIGCLLASESPSTPTDDAEACALTSTSRNSEKAAVLIAVVTMASPTLLANPASIASQVNASNPKIIPVARRCALYHARTCRDRKSTSSSSSMQRGPLHHEPGSSGKSAAVDDRSTLAQVKAVAIRVPGLVTVNAFMGEPSVVPPIGDGGLESERGDEPAWLALLAPATLTRRSSAFAVRTSMDSRPL
mmetsp:Transcript_28739/g.99132  ORF Transcript_28739/g.99132 Transcript_28739/m.99132 type:complete len:555 (+) Transcript_28739:1252-2916(+)